jgi:dihydropteroate synthase
MIREKHPSTIISIDTMRSEVAAEALKAGAHLINDVSAGVFDKKMIPTVSRFRVPYVLMHMRGTPKTMQLNPRYKNVVLDVLNFLAKKTDKCRKEGIMDIIIDPGFGFGKSMNHNYQLLNELMAFEMLGHPILVGISRKSMIYKMLNIKSKDSLNGTTALNMAALLKGASILRVHDVKEGVETVTLFNAMVDQSPDCNRNKHMKTN